MGRGVAGLLVGALVAAGCGSALPPADRPNVLLVVVDTLRADRLGAYGNTRGLTPFLDELAARGQVVRRARTQAPWTNPAVASIFTSRYQSQHGIVDFASVLSETELTLAEVLKADGYATGAFVANGLIGSARGFGQGFDRYDAHFLDPSDDPAYLRVPRRAERTSADALAWVDQVEAQHPDGVPIFLYLHLMEPHSPYAPPPDVVARLRGAAPPLDLRWASEAMYLETLTPLPAAQLADVMDAYDASVLAMDEALRVFFADLERRGFLRNAVVVVTADHGEEFQEHGSRGHGKTLFDEVIHVPLIIVPPGAPAPGTVDQLVSSVDIAPTILELAGVPIPARFAGTSIGSALDASWRGRLARIVARVTGRGPEPTSYSEHLRAASAPPESHFPQVRSLTVGDVKMIGWYDGERRFYALDFDPGEQDPNLVEAPDRERVEARLGEARTRAERDPSQAGVRPPDAETQDALRALGYLQ